MMRTTRAGSSMLARFSSRSVNVPRRTFAASSVSRAGLLDDMYVKYLKEYKSPPEKAGEAEQHVKKFSPPAAPKSPEDQNLASEMKAYEDQQVEIEGQAASATGETAKPEEDYFEDIEEKPEAEAHH